VTDPDEEMSASAVYHLGVCRFAVVCVAGRKERRTDFISNLRLVPVRIGNSTGVFQERLEYLQRFRSEESL
jgi:hypothetical protein